MIGMYDTAGLSEPWETFNHYTASATTDCAGRQLSGEDDIYIRALIEGEPISDSCQIIERKRAEGFVDPWVRPVTKPPLPTPKVNWKLNPFVPTMEWQEKARVMCSSSIADTTPKHPLPTMENDVDGILLALIEKEQTDSSYYYELCVHRAKYFGDGSKGPSQSP